MNKIKLIKLLIMPLVALSLVAQELDQDFLNSLPDEIGRAHV